MTSNSVHPEAVIYPAELTALNDLVCGPGMGKLVSGAYYSITLRYFGQLEPSLSARA